MSVIAAQDKLQREEDAAEKAAQAKAKKEGAARERELASLKRLEKKAMEEMRMKQQVRKRKRNLDFMRFVRISVSLTGKCAGGDGGAQGAEGGAELSRPAA